MWVFGDISRQYGQVVLSQEATLVHVIVAADDKFICSRCPQRTVKRVQRLDEAKWYELTSKQKRRFVECIVDIGSNFACYYTRFTTEHLLSASRPHCWFGDESLDHDVITKVIGRVYSCLIEHCLRDWPTTPAPLHVAFDRVYAHRKSDVVENVILSRLSDMNVESVSAVDSTGTKGVQTADCLAGMIAEHALGLADWRSVESSDNIVDCTDMALDEIDATLLENDCMR